MARKESFDKTALRLISGTPFTGGEFYRIVKSTGIGEYVKIEDRKVVEFIKDTHDDDPPQNPKYKDKIHRTENGLELRGIVSIDGTPIEYYGTEKGWEKFKSEWDGT